MQNVAKSHGSLSQVSTETLSDAEGFEDIQPLKLTDRVAPGWAAIIGAFFSIAIYLFLASVAVFTVFFEESVVRNGSWLLAPLLTLLGLIPVFGIVVFEYAYSRALAGFRYYRGVAARRVQAAAGVLTLLVMTLVHPLTGAATLLCTGLGGLVLLGLAMVRRTERLWDFVDSEAVAILAGRDRTGLNLATKEVREHALSGKSVLAFTTLALVAGYGSGSYLTTTLVIDPSAVTAIALLNALATYSILAMVRDAMKTPGEPFQDHAIVEAVAQHDKSENADVGLHVKNLTVFERGGRTLLSDVSFSMPPGTVLGIDGDSGAGKSLLLSIMSDPYSARELHVRGHVSMNGNDLWLRDARENFAPAVHVSDPAFILPTSGENNLACFQSGQILELARKNLERLVFSTEAVDEICNAPDATKLPGTYQKALALARAFTMAPSVYLLDRPEDALPEKQIAALLGRMADETRLGRSVVTVTQNRAILEACDKILVLQSGSVVDFGSAQEVRERKTAGWARFVAERNLEVEDNLETWIRSHFKRPGDEANRRKVAHIASEMLAFSCQGTSGIDGPRTLHFEFKHFVNYCVLRMQDSDAPITTSRLNRAQQEAKAKTDGVRLSPLASIFAQSKEVEAGVEIDKRVLTVKIATYDPRQGQLDKLDETPTI